MWYAALQPSYVFFRHRPSLLRWLAKLIGYRDTAEDLMQETWMRVAARTGIDRPASFLDRVARNLAHDHLRSLVVQRVSGPAALEVLACHEPAPDQVLLGRERVRRAEAALATMPPRRRTVFLAVRLEGMPPVQALPSLKRRRAADLRARTVRRVAVVVHCWTAGPAPAAGPFRDNAHPACEPGVAMA